jgi:hypothetical protein
MENKNLFIQEIQGVFFDSESAEHLINKWLTSYFEYDILNLPDSNYFDDFKTAIQYCETTADLHNVKLSFLQSMNHYLETL